MALNKRLIPVFDKDGKEYKVDNLNAHDMVVHLGYTYAPGKKFSPVDNAPHAGKPVSAVEEKKLAQSILDGVGTNVSMAEVAVQVDEDMPEDDAVEADTIFPDMQAEEEENEITESTSDEANEPAPRRRGRPAKE